MAAIRKEALYGGIVDAGAAAVEAFDLGRLDRSFYEDPYPVFHALRRRALQPLPGQPVTVASLGVGRDAPQHLG